MTFRSITKMALTVFLLSATSLAFSQITDGGSPAEKPAVERFLIKGANGARTNEPIIRNVGGTGEVDLDIDMSGYNSWDEAGAAINEIITENVGPGGVMTGIGWDLSLTAVGTSWLSEAVMGFGDYNVDGFFLTVGVGNNAPGTGNFSSGGIIDLSDNGIPDQTGVPIEFFESFDDVPGAIDGTYNSGTITIRYIPGAMVPTLGEYGMIAFITLLAFAGIVAMRRNRQGLLV